MTCQKLEKQLAYLGLEINSMTGTIKSQKHNGKIKDNLNKLVSDINSLFKQYADSNYNKTLNLKLLDPKRFEDFFSPKLPIILCFQLEDVEIGDLLGNINIMAEKVQYWKETYPEYSYIDIDSKYQYYNDQKTTYFLEGNRVETSEEEEIRFQILFKISLLLRYSKVCAYYEKKKKEDKEYQDFLKLKDKYEKTI